MNLTPPPLSPVRGDSEWRWQPGCGVLVKSNLLPRKLMRFDLSANIHCQCCCQLSLLYLTCCPGGRSIAGPGLVMCSVMRLQQRGSHLSSVPLPSHRSAGSRTILQYCCTLTTPIQRRGGPEPSILIFHTLYKPEFLPAVSPVFTSTIDKSIFLFWNNTFLSR